jgi:hypothetical protein
MEIISVLKHKSVAHSINQHNNITTIIPRMKHSPYNKKEYPSRQQCNHTRVSMADLSPKNADLELALAFKNLASSHTQVSMNSFNCACSAFLQPACVQALAHCSQRIYTVWPTAARVLLQKLGFLNFRNFHCQDLRLTETLMRP